MNLGQVPEYLIAISLLIQPELFLMFHIKEASQWDTSMVEHISRSWRAMLGSGSNASLSHRGQERATRRRWRFGLELKIIWAR